jgi:hypothetical protein
MTRPYGGSKEFDPYRAILPMQQGHGDVENKTRFPHLHTPDED